MSGRIRPIAVDVGNSAVKIAVGPSVIRAFAHQQSNWIEEAFRWVEDHVHEGPRKWWISSVNQAATLPLTKAIAASEEILEIVDAERIPIDIDVDQPERVGRDRLLSAYAICSRAPLPSIVVDAGSAVTVDLVQSGESGRPVFSGGAILAGLRLQLTALAGGTEAIQLLEDSARQKAGNPFLPGRNTQQAIRVGAGAAVIGGIDRLIVEYSRHFGFCSDEHGLPSVSITGGDADILSEHLQTEHTVIPNLVCLGLLDVAEHFAKPSSEG